MTPSHPLPSEPDLPPIPQPTPEEEREAVLAERLDWEAEQEAKALPSEPDLAALRDALDTDDFRDRHERAFRDHILGAVDRHVEHACDDLCSEAILDRLVGKHPVNEYPLGALAAATPTAPALDVERLAEALFQIHHVIPWRWWDGSDVTGTSVEFAAEIARQYARLSPPVDRDAPREPAS